MLNSERKRYVDRMWQELHKVQMELVDDKTVFMENRVSFTLSRYHFSLENIASDGCRIVRTYFACESLEKLRECLVWIFNNTEFHEVTAFVRDCSYVTFRSVRDIELTFDWYYNSRKTVTTTEFEKEKEAFFRKHSNEFKVDTGEWKDNSYLKTYMFDDGAVWYEKLSKVYESVDFEHRGLKFNTTVAMSEVEYWSSESGSRYVYEPW